MKMSIIPPASFGIRLRRRLCLRRSLINSYEFYDATLTRTDANAQRGEPMAHVAAPHLVHERRQDARAGAAERVPERDRAAVHVGGLMREPQFAHDGQRLHGEGLVEFDQADVFH